MKAPAVCLLATIVTLALAPAVAAAAETFTLEPFGTLTVYRSTPRPAHLVLFVSGDGGWKLGVVDMARELASMDALVVGIDITRYIKTVVGGAPSADSAATACFDPAGDFARLGKAAAERFGVSDQPPILVGYSSGATLVYATLVQAPPRAFAGGVSLGFCPDLIVNMPICKGNGLAWQRDPHHKGVDFLPSRLLEVPWVALQGDVDKICTPADTRAYVAKVPHGELVWLHKVGHGFSVPRRWMAQFKDSFARVARAAARPSPRGAVLGEDSLLDTAADLDEAAGGEGVQDDRRRDAALDRVPVVPHEDLGAAPAAQPGDRRHGAREIELDQPEGEPVRRRGDLEQQQLAAIAEHSAELAEGGPQVGDVAQGVSHRQQVEALAGERQGLGEPAHPLAHPASARLAQHAQAGIESGDPPCGADDGLRVRGQDSRPAAEIEDAHPAGEPGPEQHAPAVPVAAAEAHDLGDPVVVPGGLVEPLVHAPPVLRLAVVVAPQGRMRRQRQLGHQARGFRTGPGQRTRRSMASSVGHPHRAIAASSSVRSSFMTLATPSAPAAARPQR
jgi:predicted esterase